MGNNQNILKKIRRNNILLRIFTFIRSNKKLNIIKYNNYLKNILNINSYHYMNLIIIDLKLIEQIPNISSYR